LDNTQEVSNTTSYVIILLST